MRMKIVRMHVDSRTRKDTAYREQIEQMRVLDLQELIFGFYLEQWYSSGANGRGRACKSEHSKLVGRQSRA